MRALIEGPKVIGQLVRRIRHERRTTQRQLAEACRGATVGRAER